MRRTNNPRGRMDVHRLKFLDIKPHTILSLAFNGSTDSPRIAVSRSDGSIEIWSVISDEGRELAHLITIPGREDVSVEKILWFKHRLFSAGLTGFVIEWDPINLCSINTADALGSPIWSFDADCTLDRLAAGTDDGKICIYDVSSNCLSLSRTLDNQNCRILSLSWHPKGFNIAVGCSDSTVRIIDVESGHCTLRISIDKVGRDDTLVWDVKFLSDFTVVTGSSTGKTQFWNGQYGTLKHNYQSHLADILTLVLNEDENILYASGIDTKVVQFKKVNDDNVVWVQCQGVRAHTHDVKSLAIASGDTLFSGGVDTELIMYNADSFDLSNTTRYSPFSSWSDRFKYAAFSNTLMYQNTTSLKFWMITPKRNQMSSSNTCSPDKDAIRSQLSICQSPTPSDSNISLPSLTSSVESDLLISSGLPVNFLEIKASTIDHILSSALSSDGKMVVFSSRYKTWVYCIVSAVCISSSDMTAHSIAISPDNSMIILGLADGGLVKAKLPSSLDRHTDIVFETVYKQKNKLSSVFSMVQYSPCGKYLLTLNRKFRMFLFDALSMACIAKLPRLDDYRTPHAIFDPLLPLLYIFASSNKELYTYNIKEESLTSSLTLPKYRHSEKILGCTNGFSVLCKPQKHLIVYDTNNLLIIRDNDDKTPFLKISRAGKKRPRESISLPYKMINNYKDIVFITPLQCGELLIVEKPWTDVLSGLPNSLQRKKYAT